jgi:probable rRNA maturation factor
MPAALPTRSVSGPDTGEARPPADAEPQIGLLIDVVHEAGDWSRLGDAGEAARGAAAALAAELGIEEGEACLALSSDAEVERLNAAYRGKRAPTNVLSFPAPPALRCVPAGQAPFLGDLVLAAETVTREAGELGVPVAHHLQHLVVHGLLHLLGYDHESDEEADAMEALEVRILARLGIANPYAVVGDPLPQGAEQMDPEKP